METANSGISSSTKRFSTRIDSISVLFFILAIVAGVAVAVVGNIFGWVSLLAVPVLVVGFAILLQPEWGLAVFGAVVYIQLHRVILLYHPSIPGYLSPVYPLMGILFFLMIWRAFIYGERPAGWKRASIVFILVAYWLFSATIADDPAHGLIKFQNVAQNSIYAFIFVFFIQRPTSLRRVIWILLFAAIFVTALTIFQNLTSTFSNSYWGFAQWEYSSTGATTNYRAAGTYGNANAYAQSLIMLVPLALDRFWYEKRFVLRLLAGIALAGCILAIFFTYSRNGFVTLIFTLIFLFAVHRPNIVPLAITGLLVILLLQFLPVSYLDRISTLVQFSSADRTVQVSDQSFRGRLSENIAAWQMFRDKPLFGVGLDNFEKNYQAYSRKIGLDPRRVERSPASLYLELLSEQGLVGTTLFMVFIIMIFRSMWKARKLFQSLGMYDNGNLVLAFISGLLGYMVFYISKSGSYSNAFWVLLGIAFSIEQVAENSRASQDVDANLSVMRHE